MFSDITSYGIRKLFISMLLNVFVAISKRLMTSLMGMLVELIAIAIGMKTAINNDDLN